MKTNSNGNERPGQPLIGVSDNIVKVRELIELVADSGFNIIVTGETGVGKEVVARNLYNTSPRRNEPFITINCAAMPEGLLESELFGYEEGAFTGATRKRRGKFELAHGGVLFLDEIGDMPLPLQSKLLHVLQSGEFSPLGSENDLKTDVWTIAATNQDLEESIENRQFREDLYYRLNIINIHLSPLRERPEDIPLLTDFFMKKYSGEFNGRAPIDFSGRLMQKMQEHRWPGNVRELENVLKRMLVVGSPEAIIDELLRGDAPARDAAPPAPAGIQGATPITSANDLIELSMVDAFDMENPVPLKEIKKNALDKVEKEVITYVLNKTEWNRSWAAKILKVSYKTILNKIKEFKIEYAPEPAQVRGAPSENERDEGGGAAPLFTFQSDYNSLCADARGHAS